jgi:hypothetical protein
VCRASHESAAELNGIWGWGKACSGQLVGEMVVVEVHSLPRFYAGYRLLMAGLLCLKARFLVKIGGVILAKQCILSAAEESGTVL